MANRLTSEEETAFIRSCEMTDYIEYVEYCISDNEMPLKYQEWIDIGCPSKAGETT
jgi:hypothetical protein